MPPSPVPSSEPWTLRPPSGPQGGPGGGAATLAAAGSAVTFLVLAGLLGVLGWRRAGPVPRRILAWAGAAALGFALAFALEAGGLRAPALRPLAALAGLVAAWLGFRAVRPREAAPELEPPAGGPPATCLEAGLQHQRLESLGLLAGGIAHDFNNLLGAMVGNVELFRLEMGPGGPGESRLGTMEQLLDRAACLVEQILACAGKGGFQLQALDLNRQVEEMIRVLRACLGRNVSLRWEPAPGLPPMAGNPAQIQQLVMNLVLNAWEAVEPAGGVILIRTGSQRLTREELDQALPGQALKPGLLLTLEVADDGPGMAPEVQARIFEPFFSTKAAGRGLGLAAVQGILRSHQGGIEVVSAAGAGASFKLLFPAALAPAPVDLRRPLAAAQAAVPGSGTILVVDDEDELRAVAVAALGRLGFQTLEARDGLEALQVYQANQEQVRLVLMDLTMPRMDGEEAYQELRRAGSRVPVILSSGFDQGTALQRFRGRGLAGFLSKPYRLQELEATVRNSLEGRRGRTRRWGDPCGAGIAWIPEFETGHPLMDAQHRGLVLAFNRLAALAERASGPEETGRALGQLLYASLTHFGVEENLMQAGAYPGAGAHQALHARLTCQIQDLARQFREGRSTLTPEVLDFLEDWLLCHIRFEDAQLARYLLVKGN